MDLEIFLILTLGAGCLLCAVFVARKKVHDMSYKAERAEFWKRVRAGDPPAVPPIHCNEYGVQSADPRDTLASLNFQKAAGAFRARWKRIRGGQ